LSKESKKNKIVGKQFLPPSPPFFVHPFPTSCQFLLTLAGNLGSKQLPTTAMKPSPSKLCGNAWFHLELFTISNRELKHRPF